MKIFDQHHEKIQAQFRKTRGCVTVRSDVCPANDLTGINIEYSRDVTITCFHFNDNSLQTVCIINYTRFKLGIVRRVNVHEFSKSRIEGARSRLHNFPERDITRNHVCNLLAYRTVNIADCFFICTVRHSRRAFQRRTGFINNCTHNSRVCSFALEYLFPSVCKLPYYTKRLTRK